MLNSRDTKILFKYDFLNHDKLMTVNIEGNQEKQAGMWIPNFGTNDNFNTWIDVFEGFS